MTQSDPLDGAFGGRTVAGAAYDGSAHAGATFRLYQAAFGRSPDQGGLTFWTGALNGGWLDVRGVAANFVGSAEFAARFGTNPTPEQLVDRLYHNLLGRDGDPAGTASWVATLHNGGSVADVLIGFAESPENQARVAALVGQPGGHDGLAWGL